MLSIDTKLRSKNVVNNRFDSYWDGRLDELALVNNTLSSEETRFIYREIYSDKRQ